MLSQEANKVDIMSINIKREKKENKHHPIPFLMDILFYVIYIYIPPVRFSMIIHLSQECSTPESRIEKNIRNAMCKRER